MARTDDDSWDVTEGVGATALSVAMARAGETAAEHPLFTDPYAQIFLDAATERGWRQPFTEDMVAELQKADPQLPARMAAMAGYTASRTKYFDDFFSGANGLEQVVILAAGLDTRAWRLPWVRHAKIYEIDQPKVLEFKAQTLRAHRAEPAADYVAVGVDLRRDWPKALRDAGFDPAEPTAWSAEGLLPYLPAEAQDLLFERITELSGPGSRVAVEAFSPEFYDPGNLARRREQMRQVREAAATTGAKDVVDTEQLWYLEARTDVADWLSGHGWEVTAIKAKDLMAHYHRPVPEEVQDAILDSVFVEGRLP